MPWTNFHSHTHYCDGKAEPEAFAKSAIGNGLIAYGFSSHAPINFGTDWCVPDDQFDAYIKEINSIKRINSQTEFYLGLEIDYIPEIAGRKYHLTKDCELDYFIGSIHFVDQFEDGTPWNIDTSFELFQKGLKDIYNGDYRKAASSFYAITREMIKEDKPDVIGHIDKIKMYNETGNFFDGNEPWYKREVEETLDIIAQYNSIIELNTRGFYRYGQKELYPSPWILEMIKEKEIPVVLNSDAHAPDEICDGFEYAVDVLKGVGIEELAALIGRKWNLYKYDESGLIV